jgi:hypothetical protein
MRLKRLARFSSVFTVTLAAMLLASAMAQARLGVPRLVSPSSRSTVRALPAFTWRPVRKAAEYQIEFSGTRSFTAGVADISAGPITVTTTGFTNAAAIPNGTYYWRVRAVSATNVPGRWSRIRKITKRWATAPKLLTPVGSKVNWPSEPLLLKWSSVPYAVNYEIEVGTTSALSASTLVYGPVTVQGPQFDVPNVLSPGTYYWAVTPVDASGATGRRSAVKSFDWTWASGTTPNEADASPDSDYQEPSFSWTAIAGASSYEVQVATDPSYAASSIVIDATGVPSTYYNASHFYPNHTTLYWRVRAVDAHGDAGSWNDGESFTDLFDQPTPQNVHVVRADGSIDDGDTADANPIIRWSPVPGASHYNLSFVPWSSGGCNFNAAAATESTSNTAWTPGGHPPYPPYPWSQSSYDAWESNEYGWTGAANGANDVMFFPGSYCVSVIAVRDDPPLAGSTIESAPTILGGGSGPAFTYQPAAASPGLTPTIATGMQIVPPAYGSGAQPAGSTMSTTPLFEWNPVSTADGYYVIIANDEQFDSNSIVAGGFTNTSAWVPPVPLPDQTGAFWWEVIPVNSGTNAGVPANSATDGAYGPQDFNKNSSPPSAIGPISGGNAAGEPTFSWRSAQGAVNYTLEISADPTFANPIETDATDSTSFTTGATLAAQATLYWRVRANDVRYNLNWSPVQTFTHNLPIPQLRSSNPKRGSTIPLIAWASVFGATSYNVLLKTGGVSTPLSLSTPYLTPGELFSPGTTTYQVQSVFPGGGTSAYSAVRSYRRTIPPPSRIRASKHGSRILVTWKVDPIAKDYSVELSTSSGFSAPLVDTNTANTAWVPNITAAQAATKLYWRVAVVDYAGTVGSYHTGVFRHRR